MENSHEWSWGEENSYSTSYTATFPVKASPHTVVRAQAVVNSGTLDVPYILHLRSKESGIPLTTEGIWQGVTTWDLRYTIDIISPQTWPVLKDGVDPVVEEGNNA